MHTLSDLAKGWDALAQKFRPSAFWFWNSHLDEAGIERSVRAITEAGIREVLIHPINGMMVEYLSAEYFDRYRCALRMFREVGIKVWIYDEFAWPSGVAGGLLLRQHPEFCGWHLSFGKDQSGKVVCSVKRSHLVLDAVVGAPWSRRERGYLDTLSKEAVAEFIRMTHERYFKECGEFFGEVVTGFFTDEPAAMMDRNGIWSATSLPWTPELPEVLKKRYGYEIEPLYEKLADAVPSQTKADYFNVVTQLHVTAYHEQIGNWCRAHGVKYTGHCGEDTLLQQARFAGNIYQALAQMDDPGIDFLCLTPENKVEERYQEQVLIPSIARRAGRERVYCEAFGISPMSLRLADMLRGVQIFGINGIDDIALMGFHQSIVGVRKRIYWPPLFEQAPWWGHFAGFRDAMARSLCLSNSGRPVHRYALLYPQGQLEQTSVFASPYSNEDPATQTIRRIGQAVYEEGESFSFLFEENLTEATVEGGAIVMKNGDRFESVIASADMMVPGRSIELLDALEHSGARILRGSVDDIVQKLAEQSPSWSPELAVTHDGPQGALRIYRFHYEDGELLALRNAGDSELRLCIETERKLHEWEPVNGTVIATGGTLRPSLPPQSTLYLSVSSHALPETSPQTVSRKKTPLQAEWKVAAPLVNTARLSDQRFFDEEKNEWIPGETSSLGNVSPGGVIPRRFSGHTSIKWGAGFHCKDIPDDLSLMFEHGYLNELSVNGIVIDLQNAQPLKAWDTGCRLIAIRSAVRQGLNLVVAQLRYPAFEMEVVSEAFYAFHPMPSVDLFVAGSFRKMAEGSLITPPYESRLPIDLAQAGWPEFSGTLELETECEIPPSASEVEVKPIKEDGVELHLDGFSLGKRFISPYMFPLPTGRKTGTHKLTVRISNTSANRWWRDEPWGLQSVSWAF